MTSTPADIAHALVALSRQEGNPQQWLQGIYTELAHHVKGAGPLKVVLTTPTGDAKELAGKIAAMLEKKFDKPVTVTQQQDTSLIGGAVLQFGDQQIDLSVRGSLNTLQAKLQATA